MVYCYSPCRWTLEGKSLKDAIEKHGENTRSGYGLFSDLAIDQYNYYKNTKEGIEFLKEEYPDRDDEWLWEYIWDDLNLWYDDVKDHEEDLAIMVGVDLEKTVWVCDNCGEEYYANELMECGNCELFCPYCFGLYHHAKDDNYITCGNCGWEYDIDKICFEKKCDNCKDYLKSIVGECDKTKVFK